MTSRLPFGLAAIMSLAWIVPFIGATEMMGPCHHHHQGCQHCQVVEEIVYQDVVTHQCKLVPDKKPNKKIVYEIKEIPVCQKKLPCFGHCDDCPECECCARTKRVLIKKEINCGDKEGTKCVTEEVIERVPVRVQRVIPCQACQSQCAHCQAMRTTAPTTVQTARAPGKLPRVPTLVPPVTIEDASAPPPVPVPSIR